jgi:hypothetical protein
MRLVRALVAVMAVLVSVAVGSATAEAAGSYVLTATGTGGTYAPTFTGNGELGVRVPPDGQGYAAGTVPAQSELAGFYAQPAGSGRRRPRRTCRRPRVRW